MSSTHVTEAAYNLHLKLKADCRYPYDQTLESFLAFEKCVRAQVLEEAAMLLDENADDLEKHGEVRTAWQIRAEARHVRELKEK